MPNQSNGLISRQNLAPGEDEQEQQTLLAQWHEAYPTHNDHARNLVTTAAHAEWQLLRIQRGVDQLHCQLFTRYLTTARRALDRRRTAILQYRRKLRAEARQQLLETKTTSKTKEPEPEPKPKPFTPSASPDYPLRQDIHISRDKNGNTETFYCQSNALMLTNTKRAFERCLEFDGDTVPPEYAWCADEVKLPKTGISLCLALSVQSFRIAVEREKETGHIRRWHDLLELDIPHIQEYYRKWRPK